jgi:sodium/potassium-transporting ATPase subunit alpha
MVNVIAVLVAFIPTGLPVAVTLSLLLMAKKMAKHKVLVKNLTTIETLSCVNVIASDKTGTLTQNKMFVASASAGMKIVDIKIKDDHSSYKQLVASSLLCNNASFINSTNVENIPINQRQAKGDATDVALLRFGAENIDNSNILENFTELSEIPFNSKNKWMMKFFSPKDNTLNSDVFNLNEKPNLMLLKGAPDILLM